MNEEVTEARRREVPTVPKTNKKFDTWSKDYYFISWTNKIWFTESGIYRHEDGCGPFRRPRLTYRGDWPSQVPRNSGSQRGRRVTVGPLSESVRGGSDPSRDRSTIDRHTGRGTVLQGSCLGRGSLYSCVTVTLTLVPLFLSGRQGTCGTQGHLSLWSSRPTVQDGVRTDVHCKIVLYL